MGFSPPARIKLTSQPILDIARQAARDHMMTYVEAYSMPSDQIDQHVEDCVAKMATWPESLAIQYLLRDLEPEDFYHA